MSVRHFMIGRHEFGRRHDHQNDSVPAFLSNPSSHPLGGC